VEFVKKHNLENGNTNAPKAAQTLTVGQRNLIDHASEIWSEDAKTAGALTFWPRALLQVTLPHNNPGAVPAWGRRCGDFFLVVEPGHRIDRDVRIDPALASLTSQQAGEAHQKPNHRPRRQPVGFHA
jgi:hypothetical protein